MTIEVGARPSIVYAQPIHGEIVGFAAASA